ncbi:hypothetical protein RJP21_04855 [Paenibacillus sp. VCA1]|uniref:hypothetical protein n=1 Tax=Paenibacillus sp. VCA1 TaxID=3039148 RepID=UPI002870DB2F|nr:hypothetical protein [Paenibacillus sp. VCA1]MDR9852930.1 hypothetical protein [Paenibacillus sp. VCA1]
MFNEVKRKAAVGERIKIVDAMVTFGKYQNGDEFTVKELRETGISPNEVSAGIWHEEYVVLEPVAPAALSDDSADLTQAFAQFVRENADAIRKYLDQIEQPQVVGATPVPKPLTRADVIGMARKDVAELLRIGRDDNSRLPQESSPFRSEWFDVEFHVNRDKRTVVALVHKLNGFSNVPYPRKAGGPHAKGIAKCAPGDVFHADLGKAIALRKALGLTIPTEYTDAPQPDEPRVGMVALWDSFLSGPVRTAFTKRAPQHDGSDFGNYAFYHTSFSGWIADKQYKVIDDTDVDYSVGSAEEAA